MPKVTFESIIIKENWDGFTEQDHHVWKMLFKRQTKILKNRAAAVFLESLKCLKICDNKIPKFSEINKILSKSTGWKVVPVAGYIPAEMYFELLSNKQFPSTCFIRSFDQLDYIEKPDIFHDIFGHVPLLANPIFASFMEMFGHKALEAIAMNKLEQISRLYWFTVEFGLINSKQGPRIYGAGIVSSKNEALYSTSFKPKHIKFEMERVIRTRFKIDEVQKTYFLINDFDELLLCFDKINLSELFESIKDADDIKEGEILGTDQIIGGSNYEENCM